MKEATPGIRIRMARESSELTPEALADRLGITVPWYYDLEYSPDEVNCNISITQLRSLANALHLSLSYILLGTDLPPSQTKLTALQVVDRLRTKIAGSGKSLDAIADEIGWHVGLILGNPDELWEYTLDGVRDVCLFIDEDWKNFVFSSPECSLP